MISVPNAARAAAVLLALLPASVPGQQHSLPIDSAVPAPPLPYAPFADLVLAAPVIVDAAIHGTTRIKGPEAANVEPGHARLYVEADVQALIRGGHPLPPRIGYLLDVPLDAHGGLPRLNKLRVLLFARQVAGAPDQIQLVRRDAQKRWSPEADALVRRITGEVLTADPPPEISGITHAFHMPGALPGEGETQVFLQTPDNRPVSLSIASKPDQPRTWTVALSEIVDQAQPPPARGTLLWYRLACGLPRELPDAAVADSAPGDADVARDDYRFVMQSLGPCDR